MTWDKFFIDMTFFVSKKSEDKNTQCGAVIVGSENEVISIGYNGFPRGVKDTEERQERPLKYSFFEHAERNAIYNVARTGATTKDSKIYITGMPCCDCARAIIQSGIKEIVVPIETQHQKDFAQRWAESIKVSETMLEEAGVKIRKV